MRGNGPYFAFGQVYVSDGTAAGTHVVQPLNNPATYNGATYQDALDLTVSAGRLYFTATDPVNGSPVYGRELWTVNPVSGVASMVEDIDPGPGDGLGAKNTSHQPSTLTPFNNGVIFPATDGTDGWQLWYSGGTAATTYMIKALNTNPAIQNKDANPSTPVVLGGYAYFAAFDGTYQPDGTPSSVLWRTDGTAAGTTEIQKFSNVYSFFSNPFNGIPVNSVNGELLYETNGENDLSSYLWALNTTTLVSTQLANIYASGASAGASVGNVLYFVAEGATTGYYDLWETDGTADGTVPAETKNTGTPFNNNYTYYSVANPAALNGSVIFAGNDGLHGTEPMGLAPMAITDVYTYGTVAYQNNVLQSGQPGVFTALDNTDDGAAPINLGSNMFNFYGVNYTGATASTSAATA